jgi:hypothetical protein
MESLDLEGLGIQLLDGNFTVGVRQSSNVGGQMLPLASGMSTAREAESAGDMPEVPKGRELSGPLC